MLKLKPIQLLLGFLVASWFTAGTAYERTAFADHRGRNPWVSEIGEAIDVAHTSKLISDRLREKFPYCPAATSAQRMVRSANEIKTLVEEGAHQRAIHSAMRDTRSLATQVHRSISEDRHVRSDSRLLSLIGELNKRLDRLDSELDKSIARSGGASGYTHSARYPRFDSLYVDHHRGTVQPVQPIRTPPNWNNPFPSNRYHNDHSMGHPQRYDQTHRPPAAQRILSMILSEIAD